MRTHTSGFKNNIKQLGKEIDVKITYTSNNSTITLDKEKINNVSYHYKGAILKSVMRQLDIDSNNDIPLNTIINFQFGLKVGNSYEYINYGNFIVYKSEKQEDTNSYKITCYDKMLYSMKDYENSNITYPITIKNYINTICSKLGLTFANSNDNFVNYNQSIASELYIDTDGNSLGYTFRDVLDELAEVTASTICINDNDQLEIRYITSTNDTINEEFLKDINVNFGKQVDPINTIVLSRSGGADKISQSYPSDLPDNLKKAIVIEDNQIMNGNNRADFLPAILNQFNGFTYYLNDFSSTGVCYYDLCDRYYVSIGGNTYMCIMLNDEINISQGLQENIYTDSMEEEETDYTKTTEDDRTNAIAKRAYIIANKAEGTIEATVSAIGDNSGNITPASIKLAINGDTSGIKLNASVINLSANDVLNLLAGNIINLSSKNIAMSSNNFSVDANGYVRMENATINGKIKASQFTGNTENVKLQIGSDSEGYASTDNTLEFLASDGFLNLSIFCKRFANNSQVTYFRTHSNGGFIFLGDLSSSTKIITPKLEADNIQRGEDTANSSNWTTVTFPKAFSSRPYVVVTPNTGTAGVIALKTASVTANGFSVIVGGNVSGNIDFQWIAML